MTPHQQEPCDHYAVCKIRIDKSCLVEQGKGCMFYSRPHPAPFPVDVEITIDKRTGDFDIDLTKYNKEIRRKAREDVLDELKQWFIKNKCNGCAYGGNLLDKIKSLRAQQAGERDE